MVRSAVSVEPLDYRYMSQMDSQATFCDMTTHCKPLKGQGKLKQLKFSLGANGQTYEGSIEQAEFKVKLF